MSTRKQIEKALGQAIAERAREGDRRGRAAVNVVTDAVKRGWLEVVAAIKKGNPKPEHIRDILRRTAAGAEAAIEQSLAASVSWGFDSAYQIWVDNLPAAWWKIAFRDDPETLLEGVVEFDFDEPGGPGPNAPGPRSAVAAIRAKRGLPKSKPTANPQKGKFNPAGKLPAGKPKKVSKPVSKKTAERIKAATKPKPDEILRLVRSRGWKARMRKWSKKLIDLDKVAEKIADGFRKKKTIDQIVRSIKPHVQGFAASGRRVVRTELSRIENRLLEKTFAKFSGIIAGFQIINPLDERTRPTHGIRAGKIYWTDGKRKPSADDRPELPDAPNCRCTYAPILTAPAPEELKNGPKPDPRTYAAWFNNQDDKTKRRIVGADKWKIVKGYKAKPSLFDFTSKDSTRFLSNATLKKQSETRRQTAKKAKTKDVQTAKKSLKFWPK